MSVDAPETEFDAAGFRIIPAVAPSDRLESVFAALETRWAEFRANADANSNSNAISRAGRRDWLWTMPEVRALAQWPEIQSWVITVLGDEACLVRALWFDKSAEANWRVTWHQDLTIAVAAAVPEAPGYAFSVKDGVPHAQPPVSVLENMVALRIHVDDQDADNGPLEVLPGTHRLGRLDPCAIAEFRTRQESVVCLAPRCGGILMRPLLLHASAPANRPRRRRVLHLEFAADPVLPGGVSWYHPVKVKALL